MFASRPLSLGIGRGAIGGRHVWTSLTSRRVDVIGFDPRPTILQPHWLSTLAEGVQALRFKLAAWASWQQGGPVG